jgi:Na+-driven multidrug efflux pump
MASIYWDIFSNSANIIVGCVFDILIENMNIHFATNKEMMAGIGMATILVHCVGGSLILGFGSGFVGFASRAYGAGNKEQYKRIFIQALTNLVVLLSLFVLLGFGSYYLVKATGQSS